MKTGKLIENDAAKLNKLSAFLADYCDYIKNREGQPLAAAIDEAADGLYDRISTANAYADQVAASSYVVVRCDKCGGDKASPYVLSSEQFACKCASTPEAPKCGMCGGKYLVRSTDDYEAGLMMTCPDCHGTGSATGDSR